METFRNDLKHSLRALWQSPGFTAVAVAALALGIGANTAIFSVVNTVLLKPARYLDPDRVVLFGTSGPTGAFYFASEAKFNVWREQTSVFEHVSGYRYTTVNLTEGDQPEQLEAGQVTTDFFLLAGMPIARGRGFTSEEELPNGGHAVILSDAFWRRRFGSDPHIVGKTISLGGSPNEVVGILGAGIETEHDPTPDVWLPFPIDPGSTALNHYFSALGRLKSGVTPAAAKAQLQAAAEQFRRKFPGIGPNSPLGLQNGFTVQPIQDALVKDVRGLLWILLGAVSCVLLIACANVANLLLVRATRRKREIAIRAALGATRARIICQLLTESVVLSLVGGVVGLALGSVGIRALLALNPGNIPRIGDHGSAVMMDWRVLAFTVVVSVVTGIIFGMVPSLEASRAELTTTLKASGGRSGTGFRQNIARSVLVVTEMALAIVLLVGAGLLIRTFVALRAVDPGFDRHNVLTMRMSLSEARFAEASAVSAMVRDGLNRLTALPGVVAADAAYYLPLQQGASLPFVIADRPLNDLSHGAAYWRNVSTGYFEVFKIPILRGRGFTDRDDRGAAGVVIINKAMAQRYWPKGEPLNQRIIIGKGVGRAFEEPARQIVGVAGDVHDTGLNFNAMPTMYVPVAQVPDSLNSIVARGVPLAWIVRTRVEPHSLSSEIKNQLRQASGGLPVGTIRSMDELMLQSTARMDFNMLLLTIFASLAVLLAAIGIYGLMAYSVHQRTQEIGIRLALGAASNTVWKMVVRQGMILALIGVAIGIAAAFGLTRLIASFLFGVQPRDPLVFAITPVILIAVALFSVWLPSRRASRVDPAIALRCE